MKKEDCTSRWLRPPFWNHLFFGLNLQDLMTVALEADAKKLAFFLYRYGMKTESELLQYLPRKRDQDASFIVSIFIRLAHIIA